MKDELKDFIGKNRDAFDDKVAPERVWKNVRNEVFRKGATSIRYWQAAAVIFFVLSVGLLWQGNGFSERRITTEFDDAEAFYTQEISSKMKLIHSEFSRDLNGFTQDYQQLEAMYMVLKEEMDQHPSEKVKEALVLNLLVRINLLNKQLQEIEEANKKVADSEEKAV